MHGDPPRSLNKNKTLIRIMITVENDKNYENDDNNGNGGNCGNIANNGNDESSHTQLSSIVHKKELKMR